MGDQTTGIDCLVPEADIPILKSKSPSCILAVIKMNKDSQMSEIFEIGIAIQFCCQP